MQMFIENNVYDGKCNFTNKQIIFDVWFLVKFVGQLSEIFDFKCDCSLIGKYNLRSMEKLLRENDYGLFWVLWLLICVVKFYQKCQKIPRLGIIRENDYLCLSDILSIILDSLNTLKTNSFSVCSILSWMSYWFANSSFFSLFLVASVLENLKNQTIIQWLSGLSILG